jgi:hypothetical protein
MSGEVETSQAEPDLKALEGFLVGNQDLERLDALLDYFNIFEATGWCWVTTRTRGAKEYKLPRGSSEMASCTISRKCGVRGDRARLPSSLHLHGGLFGNR